MYPTLSDNKTVNTNIDKVRMYDEEINNDER